MAITLKDSLKAFMEAGSDIIVLTPAEAPFGRLYGKVRALEADFVQMEVNTITTMVPYDKILAVQVVPEQAKEPKGRLATMFDEPA